jgi:hypothetical protein
MVLRKKIKGWDKYEITSDGRIFSLDYRRTREIKEMKPQINKCGYKIIILMNNGKYKHFRLHRLVSETFIPNKKNKPFINHKDGDKLNNNVNNLEWCSKSENEQHAFRTGLKNHRGEKHNQSKLTEKDVKLIRKYVKNVGMTYPTISKLFDVKPVTISGIINKHIWKNDKYR